MATDKVTVRIAPETTARLESIAEALDRSRNWVINQAIEQYLEAHDWQTQRIAERLQIAEQGQTVSSHDEAMARIAARMI